MYSIKFPDMFSSAKTNLIEDHEASASNLKLLLAADKTALFGDPQFGTALKKFFYEQNNTILRDLLIDEIYSSLVDYMPQLKLSRDNIIVTSDGTNIYAEIHCINRLDWQIENYTIALTTDADNV